MAVERENGANGKTGSLLLFSFFLLLMVCYVNLCRCEVALTVTMIVTNADFRKLKFYMEFSQEISGFL